MDGTVRYEFEEVSVTNNYSHNDSWRCERVGVVLSSICAFVVKYSGVSNKKKLTGVFLS